MPDYLVWDSGGTKDVVTADDAQSAAEEWVREWADLSDGCTFMADCRVVDMEYVDEDEDGRYEYLDSMVEYVSVVIEPEEPECEEDADDEHDWEQDGEAWGHGAGDGRPAGIDVTERCTRCGLLRHTDTGVNGPYGEVVRSVRYATDDDE